MGVLLTHIVCCQEEEDNDKDKDIDKPAKKRKIGKKAADDGSSSDDWFDGSFHIRKPCPQVSRESRRAGTRERERDRENKFSR